MTQQTSTPRLGTNAPEFKITGSYLNGPNSEYYRQTIEDAVNMAQLAELRLEDLPVWYDCITDCAPGAPDDSPDADDYHEFLDDLYQFAEDTEDAIMMNEPRVASVPVEHRVGVCLAAINYINENIVGNVDLNDKLEEYVQIFCS